MRTLIFPSYIALTALLAPCVSNADTEPNRLIAALSGDWNGDEMPDAVLLVQADGGNADIQVFTGDFRGLTPLYTVPAVVFAGPMAGQSPGLVALTDTSFGITTEQIGIGRTPWSSQLTVAFRDGEFLVAGYTYDFYDRLDLSHYGHCDVNMLTGDYVMTLGPGDGIADRDTGDTMNDEPDERRTGRIEPHAFLLSELIEGYASPACNGVYR